MSEHIEQTFCSNREPTIYDQEETVEEFERRLLNLATQAERLAGELRHAAGQTEGGARVAA